MLNNTIKLNRKLYSPLLLLTNIMSLLRHLHWGFSHCGFRKKILRSRNKLAFCAFEIGFFTIIFIDNQKLEKVKCHCTIVA